MTGKEQELRATWESHFQTEVRKSTDLFEWGSHVIEHDLRMAADVWDMAGFDNKNAAEYHYRHYLIACQIRTYFRRHKITTRKGSRHAFNCTREHQALFSMVRRGDMDGKIGNLRWWHRSVDELRNLYVIFD